MSQKKQIFKLSILKKLLTDENNCVSLIATTRLLALPPFFLNDMKSGILYMLNTLLKKYDRTLGGIVIGYQNVKVLMDENTGIIPIGTSETEVNISVEFYIFQPKIGSYLEGVVNKISNNHIGCLVHRYFNATILKPENVDYDDWICKDINVDDKIIFKVVDLDFTTLLPHIEGIIDDERLLSKAKCDLNGSCDIDNTTVDNVNMDPKSKALFSEKFKNVSEKKKCKNNEVSTLEDNVSKTAEDLSDSQNIKKKKKKKKEKELVNAANDQTDSNEKEENSLSLNSSTLKLLAQVEDENSNDFVKPVKEKKKKKKLKNKERDKEEPQIHVDKINQLSCCTTSSEEEKTEPETPVGIFDSVSFFLWCKQQNICLSPEAEENIFYSTQLEPILEKKMEIPFCSPIPSGMPLSVKKHETRPSQESYNYMQLNSQDEASEKQMKKKSKKRKRQEEKESESPAPKKVKVSKKEGREKEENNEKNKSESTIFEELYKQQLNRVKEALNISDKESLKEDKKKKEKIKKQAKDKLMNVSKKADMNGTGDIKEKNEEQSMIHNLYELEIQKIKEELNISDKESLKSIKKGKSSEKKEEKEMKNKKLKDKTLRAKEHTKAQINGANVDNKKCAVQDMVNELLKQEINKVKEDLKRSDTESLKGENKTKVSKEEVSKKETQDSLYKKLLQEAKNAVDLEEEKNLSLSSAKESGKKKRKRESDGLDLSTSLLMKKDKKKKKEENKIKTKDCSTTNDECKNGNMYDLVTSPEKNNPDKSLFSDSEQSHASPFKKNKNVNGVEAESKNSIVENMLKQLFKEEEEKKRLKNKSNSEGNSISVKSKKEEISKVEQKSQTSIQKEESLYEKLLKEAKTLIDSKEPTPSKKKKKK